MRRLLTITIALAISLGLPVSAAHAAVSVHLNGRAVSFDVPPRVENGRTLVPMRVIFELLGASVSWNEATQTVTAVHPATGTTIVLPVDAPTATVNGRQVVLDAPARVEQGRTLVPLRFVSETLGAQVDWDPVTERADIRWQPPSAVTVTEPRAPGAGPADGAQTGAGAWPVDRPNQAIDLTQEVVDRALRATVEVWTDVGLGSGFFIHDDGIVVTNYHVIDGASRIQIRTHDGRTHAVLGVTATDATRDVAVLKTGARHYPALPLAVRARPRAGQRVVAVGSPLGLSGTVTDGIVSNPARELDGVTYIQHTAPISSGNSGGPLILASTGEVIGMNTLTIDPSEGTAQNINLAVPSSVIEDVVASARELDDAGPPQFDLAPLPDLGSMPHEGPPEPPLGGHQGPAPEDVELLTYLMWYAEDFLPQLEQCNGEAPTADDLERSPARALRAAESAAACYHDLADQATVVVAPVKLLVFHLDMIGAARSFGNGYDALARALRYATQNQYFAAKLALDSFEFFMNEGIRYMDSATEALKALH